MSVQKSSLKTILHCAATSYEGSLFGFDLLENDEGSIAMDFVYGFNCTKSSLKCVAISSNGKYLACGGSDEKLRIYDLKSRRAIGELTQHNGAISCCQFIGDKFMISGSEDHNICIWRVHDWQCLHVLSGHKNNITDVAVHPSQKVALSVSKDESIKLWNLMTGKCAHSRSLRAIAHHVRWNFDGTHYLLTFDTEVHHVCAEDNTNTCVIQKSKYIRIQQANYLQCNGDYIVVMYDDKNLSFYSTSGVLVVTIDCKTFGRLKDFDILKISLSSESEEVVTVNVASTSGQIAILNAASLLSGESLDNATIAQYSVPADPRLTCIACVSCESSNAAGQNSVIAVVEDEVIESVEVSQEQMNNKKKNKKRKNKSVISTTSEGEESHTATVTKHDHQDKTAKKTKVRFIE